MGHSPSRLPVDLTLVPVRMHSVQMAEKHSARTPEHPAGDHQSLRTSFQAKGGRHLLVDDFDARAEGLHIGPIIAARADDTAASVKVQCRATWVISEAVVSLDGPSHTTA